LKQSAVFLDRDGTIIHDKGYLKNVSDVEFYPDTFNCLLKLQKYYQLFVITNQSGISKGITTKSEVEIVNNFIVEALKLKGVTIVRVFSCPHATEDNCTCKKPSPYFIHQAAKEFDINLEGSYIIGDHPSDVECGRNAGINSIYLLTGHGDKHKNEVDMLFPICNNLTEATELIIKKQN